MKIPTRSKLTLVTLLISAGATAFGSEVSQSGMRSGVSNYACEVATKKGIEPSSEVRRPEATFQRLDALRVR